MHGEIEIECDEPEIIAKSLKPDMDDAKRFTAKIEIKQKKLKLSVDSKDISGLMAGINSYLRLIKVAMEV